MRKVYSTDPEASSQIPTWIVLVFSGLALVMFFGWILKDLSVLVSPEQKASRIAQQLSDSQSISGNSVSGGLDNGADDTTVDRVDRRVPVGSSPSFNTDRDDAIQADKPAVNVSAGSAAQPIQEAADQSADGKPEKDRSPPGRRPIFVELPPSERSGGQAATQEPEIIADESDDDEAESSSESPVESRGVVLSQNPTAQTDNLEPAKTTLTNPEPSHTSPPSADMDALRQLIAEATTVDVTVNENARAERERGEALGLLNALSAAIQFAPGSKVASEPVITALKQIERILTDYPDTMISVLVATNESGNESQDRLLSQERGRTLIAKLVNGGVAFSRFSLQAQTDEQLPENTHRVTIQAHLKS